MLEITVASRQGVLLQRTAPDPARAIHVMIDMVLSYGVLRDGDSVFVRLKDEKPAPVAAPRGRPKAASAGAAVSSEDEDEDAEATAGLPAEIGAEDEGEADAEEAA